MSFPYTINTASPADTDSPASGDDALRNIHLVLTDGLGLPASPSTLTAAASLIGTDGQWPLHARFTNASGAGLVAGDVCVVTNGAVASVADSDTQNSLYPYVVAAETIANGAIGLFVIKGIVSVKAQGSIASGRYVVKSTTAHAIEDAGIGTAVASTGPPMGALGVAVAAAAGGFCLVYWFGQPGSWPAFYVHATSDAEATTTSGTFATLKTITTSIETNTSALIVANWRVSAAATVSFTFSGNGGSNISLLGAEFPLVGAGAGLLTIRIWQRTTNYLRGAMILTHGTGFTVKEGVGTIDADLPNATITSVAIKGLTNAGTLGLADVVIYKLPGV